MKEEGQNAAVETKNSADRKIGGKMQDRPYLAEVCRCSLFVQQRWSRRRDYPRLYGQAERRGFYERLDGFADAGVRSREPTAENKASHFQTFRRLWFKPLTTAKTPRRQKCHLGVLVEATGFEPTTSWSRTKRATKLRYASNSEYYIKPNALLQAILSRCSKNPARWSGGVISKRSETGL